jgi:hypothetical protein
MRRGAKSNLPSESVACAGTTIAAHLEINKFESSPDKR